METSQVMPSCESWRHCIHLFPNREGLSVSVRQSPEICTIRRSTLFTCTESSWNVGISRVHQNVAMNIQRKVKRPIGWTVARRLLSHKSDTFGRVSSQAVDFQELYSTIFEKIHW